MTDNNTLRVPPFSFKDNRIVYGAMCAWWDSIDKVGTDNVIPTCPHCGGVLFEMQSPEEWWGGVEFYQANGHPDYRLFVEWLRGKCFKNAKAAQAAYEAETGRKVL